MLPPFLGPPAQGSPASATITISSPVSNWVLLDNLTFTPVTPLTVTLTVNAVVDSVSDALPAMDLRGLPSGSTIALTNTSHILGRGGDGGSGNDFSGAVSAHGGKDGGTAILGPGPGNTLDITNAAGNVWGGGGGGGGGGWTSKPFNPYEPAWLSGSGGGGGAGGGLGGALNENGDYGPTDPGAAGTTGPAGTGGLGGTAQNDGGNGGAYGAAGTLGVGTDRGAVGAAGYYVRSSGGTVNWISGGAGPNVVGQAD